MDLAIDMMNQAKQFEEKFGKKIGLKIVIGYGKVSAGVIGAKVIKRINFH